MNDVLRNESLTESGVEGERTSRLCYTTGSVLGILHESFSLILGTHTGTSNLIKAISKQTQKEGKATRMSRGRGAEK